MPQFPSIEWIESVQELANTDQDFLRACRKWPGDRYILVCEEDDAFAETVCFYIEVDEEGIACVDEIESPLDEEAEFTITATYSVWKKAIRSGEKGITFLMRGEITIEGDREELLRRAKESQDLVKLFGRVQTSFADEA